MADHIDPRTLRIAIQRTWLGVRNRWFSSRESEIATGEEVRNVVRRWLDHDSNPNPNLFRFWYPLKDTQKEQALLFALPDKVYASAENEAKQFVIQLLQEYDARFEEILSITREKQSLRKEEKERAQQLLKELKADLQEDCKEEGRRGNDITDCERRFYYPAIQKCFANIQVRYNTDPIRSNWHTDLYGARLDITSYLHRLTHTDDKVTS